MKIPKKIGSAVLAFLIGVSAQAAPIALKANQESTNTTNPKNNQKTQCEISAGISSFSGKTVYVIEYEKLANSSIDSLDPTGGRFDFKSKLEFDLNATLANIKAKIKKGALSLTGKYSFSVDERNGKFRDRDWLYNEYINSNIGYDPLGGDTVSDTKSPIRILNLELSKKLHEKNKFCISGQVNYENQKLGTFYVNNANGFYRSWLANGKYVAVDSEYIAPALSYLVRYNTITAGVSAKLTLGKLSLENKANVPGGMYKDEDRHILKAIRAEGNGGTLGFELAEKASFELEKTKISAFAQYKNLKGSGVQTQYREQNNSVIGEVNQTIETNQLNVGTEISFKF